MAVNCWLVPSAIEGFAGVTAIDTKVAGVTVRLLDPLIAPDVALMLAFPTATAFTSPVLETVAVAAEEELQVAVLVRSCVLPSL